MKRKRVLITSAYLHPEHEVPKTLVAAGVEPIFSPFRGSRPEGEMGRLLQGIDAVIASGDRFSAATLEAADRLRVIARAGVGYDAIDLKAATERGIVVCTAPGANADAVADYTLGLILQCARQLKENLTEIPLGRWVRHEGKDLRGRVLGIVGLGTIGKQVATRAVAFGMKVIATSPHPDLPFARQHGISYLPLEKLLSDSDYVSLHLPLDRDTRHLIDARRLALMKPGAYLINTARGGVVDTDALCEALETGKLAGAALDVFEEEPLGDSPLRSFANVYLSTHVAGYSHDSQVRASGVAAQNVLAVLSGGRPLNIVNPESLYRRREQDSLSG